MEKTKTWYRDKHQSRPRPRWPPQARGRCFLKIFRLARIFQTGFFVASFPARLILHGRCHIVRPLTNSAQPALYEAYFGKFTCAHHRVLHKFRVFKPRRIMRKNGYLFPLNCLLPLTYWIYELLFSLGNNLVKQEISYIISIACHIEKPLLIPFISLHKFLCCQVL